MEKYYNIAVIGPESTGKSFLTKALAKRLNGDFVLEYARKFMESSSEKYTLDTVNYIGQNQWEEEQLLIQNSRKKWRFFDTNLDVIRIWQEIVFNTCDISILKKINSRQYSCYLLCYPDLEWEEDPLREIPDENERLKIFMMYHEIVLDSGIPFYIVKGRNEERVSKTIEYLYAQMPTLKR